MYFDTHAHYDDEAFDTDRYTLLRSLKSRGVALIINPACDVKSSYKSVELSESFDFVYSSVGIHPENIDGYEDSMLDELYELAQNKKCVAIGEIGLDYYWDKEHKEEQKEIFIKQTELALDLDLPIIVHDREAHGDALDIISRYSDLKGVFHCYSGSIDMAKELIKRGFYLGFDGPVTYKNAKKTIEVLEYCPLDRILIETDSPYLSPVPMRGKRNDSSSLKYIAEKISELKSCSIEELAEITKENGKRLFNIGTF